MGEASLGMKWDFAIAIWDARSQTLLLAQITGVKPLYYSEHQSTVFAVKLKILKLAPFRMDKMQFRRYFCFIYCLVRELPRVSKAGSAVIKNLEDNYNGSTLSVLFRWTFK